jgi:hypothetical protein
MLINNREDANRYYQIINDLIDDYIYKWKIKPSNLKKYLNPGSQRFKNFLKRNKLDGIQGSEKILKDVIEDRYHMEKDGVLNFESFKYFESNDFKITSLKENLYKGIEKSTINMEKILADYFDTNLSDIDIINSDKHIFKLNDWNNKDHKVIIFSKEEIDVIIINIVQYLYNELSNKKIEIAEHISIELSNLIDKDIFTYKITKILTRDLIKKLITDTIGDDFKFKDVYKQHYIWIS